MTLLIEQCQLDNISLTKELTDCEKQTVLAQQTAESEHKLYVNAKKSLEASKQLNTSLKKDVKKAERKVIRVKVKGVIIGVIGTIIVESIIKFGKSK